jgi:hypothetical protein
MYPPAAAFVTLANIMENTGQIRKLLRLLSLPGLVGLRLLRGMSFLWMTCKRRLLTQDSTAILFMSHKHDDELGPKSNYGRETGSVPAIQETEGKTTTV